MYRSERRPNLGFKFRQLHLCHSPYYVIVYLLVVKDMDKPVSNATHFYPWYFGMRLLKLFRNVSGRFADSGDVKRRSILQTHIFKEIRFAHVGKNSLEALYPFYHVQKPLHISVNTVNHSSCISFLTL